MLLEVVSIVVGVFGGLFGGAIIPLNIVIYKKVCENLEYMRQKQDQQDEKIVELNHKISAKMSEEQLRRILDDKFGTQNADVR